MGQLVRQRAPRPHPNKHATILTRPGYRETERKSRGLDGGIYIFGREEEMDEAASCPRRLRAVHNGPLVKNFRSGMDTA